MLIRTCAVRLHGLHFFDVPLPGGAQTCLHCRLSLLLLAVFICPPKPPPQPHFLPPAYSSQALSSILDKEVWKRLPAQLPSMAEALAARSSSSDELGGGTASSSTTSGSGGSANGGFPPFEQFVIGGNPWRRQQSPRGRRRQQQLGFGGAAGSGLDDSQAGRALEVDEYGIPRTASSTPSMTAAVTQSELDQDSTGFTEDGEADAEPDDVYGEGGDRAWDQRWSVGAAGRSSERCKAAGPWSMRRPAGSPPCARLAPGACTAEQHGALCSLLMCAPLGAMPQLPGGPLV